MLSPNQTDPLPPGIPSLNAPITMKMLAAALGPRRSGKPTSCETCRSWALHGIQGVFLESRLELSIRLTSWRAYLRFREQVEYVKNETRRRRKELARSLGRREQHRAEKAHRRARERLEKANAR